LQVARLLPRPAAVGDARRLWPKVATRFWLYQDEFERHDMSGRQAQSSFIEPRYFPWPNSPPNDERPPHDIG
jgi:hypothetical protein